MPTEMYVALVIRYRRWYWPFKLRCKTVFASKESEDHSESMREIRERFKGSGWNVYYSSAPFTQCPECGEEL